MKKLLTGIITAAVFSAIPVLADTSVNVVVNGTPAEQQGVILESRTMVPVRGVTEQLGFVVDWDADTKTATFTKDDTTIKMTAGEASFYVNDNTITPDVPQAIINDRFMLPLRAMCESVGAEVDWDGDTKTAYINTSDYSIALPRLEPGEVLITEVDKINGGKTGDNADKNKDGEITTPIPGISIQVIDLDEYPDIVNDIEF